MPEKHTGQPCKNLKLVVKSSRSLGKQKNRLSCINEDYKFSERKKDLYVIADGLGGHGNGHEASRIAVQTVVNRLSRFLSGLKSGIFLEEEIENRIKQAIEFTNSEVIYPIAFTSRALQDFGTTLALLSYFNHYVYMAHVGDSRIYLFRDNHLNCLTQDDRSIIDIDGLTPDEIHIKSLMEPRLSQYVGKENINVHTKKLAVQPNDLILMATDGLTDVVHETEMAEILSKYSFDEIPSRLVYRANYPRKIPRLYANYNGINLNTAKKDLGGKDNITLILLKFMEMQSNG